MASKWISYVDDEEADPIMVFVREIEIAGVAAEAGSTAIIFDGSQVEMPNEYLYDKKSDATIQAAKTVQAYRESAIPRRAKFAGQWRQWKDVGGFSI